MNGRPGLAKREAIIHPVNEQNGRLIPLYRRLHRESKFYGLGGTVSRYVDDIRRIVAETDTSSILDYGCGRGDNYSIHNMHSRWGGLMPTLYDPGVPKFDKLPTGKFDGVICAGVLEHIPEDELGETTDLLAGYATKWAMLILGCRKSNKRLPDGSPVHVTLRTREWWWDRLSVAFGVSAPPLLDLAAMRRRCLALVAAQPLRLYMAFE
jgi:hypothetical protein